jgi:hypothetical protein
MELVGLIMLPLTLCPRLSILWRPARAVRLTECLLCLCGQVGLGRACCYSPYSSIRKLVSCFPWSTLRVTSSVLASDVVVVAVGRECKCSYGMK